MRIFKQYKTEKGTQIVEMGALSFIRTKSEDVVNFIKNFKRCKVRVFTPEGKYLFTQVYKKGRAKKLLRIEKKIDAIVVKALDEGKA